MSFRLINLMSSYYVQILYQKNQLGTRLGKKHMIPEVNIISGKESIGMSIELVGQGVLLAPWWGVLGIRPP